MLLCYYYFLQKLCYYYHFVYIFFFYENYFYFSRDVPECSGMFHVAGFIDAQRILYSLYVPFKCDEMVIIIIIINQPFYRSDSLAFGLDLLLMSLAATQKVLKQTLGDSIVYSRSLRPGSKMCSDNINKWLYLSLGNLEQNELFPKSKS